MGRNKALIEVAGRPLWRKQLQTLEEAGARELWVSLRAEDDWLPSDIPNMRDDGAAGPLGGLISALDACRQPFVALLAVDLPRLPSQWFRSLATRCANGRGAVGWRGELNAYEPLAAIYPRELLLDAQRALNAGKLSLQAFVAGAVAQQALAQAPILPEQAGWFANWNTPDDVVES